MSDKKFIFENKEKKTFAECSPEERNQIIEAKIEGRCEHLGYMSGGWRDDPCNGSLHFNALYFDTAYRVPEPTPMSNEINWDHFPSCFKCCATDANGKSYIYSESDRENMRYRRGGFWDFIDAPSDLEQLEVTDFPGFKRGTVAPEDSLLIKPEGK